ncbi:MAG TPA: DinB family protein [Aggregatilineales bacterium]|nr:DinB family protein [Aggregatilineales bacterium]
MLDFESVRAGKTTVPQLAERLTRDDLRRLTNEMIDSQLAIIADAVDADVIFVPADPQAHDKYSATPEEITLAWTLGHVVVHTTASAEEGAFLAAEMARGVEPHGRSRAEVPWRSVTTIAQCRQRLEESRRMRLATLDLWPDPPHAEIMFHFAPNVSFPPMNMFARFIFGLMHDDSHVGQLHEIMRQARAARLDIARA